MTRIERLVAERNELAAGLTYVRSALDLDDIADEDFDAGAEFCRTAAEQIEALDAKIDSLEQIQAASADPRNVTRGDFAPMVNLNRAADVDFDALTRGNLGEAETRDAALATIERGGKRYGNSAEALARAEQLARRGDKFARHIATFGQDVYAEAWAKRMSGRSDFLTPEETRALAVGTPTSAGNLVPTHLDPTIMLVNAGSYNPFRQIARVETLAQSDGNTWNGITSAGAAISWGAESSAYTKATVTNVKPSIPLEKAKLRIDATEEALEDVANLASSVAMMLADAKDNGEAAAFAIGAGAGSNEPEGIITGLDGNTFCELANTTAATLGIVDLFAAYNGLAARFQQNATFVVSPVVLGTIEQLGIGLGGSSPTDLARGPQRSLLGQPLVVSSSFPGTPSSTTQVENWLVVGDFSHYVIVEKVGMRVKYVDTVVNGDGNPTGEAAWLLNWRVGGGTTYEGTATTNRAFVLLQDKTSA